MKTHIKRMNNVPQIETRFKGFSSITKKIRMNIVTASTGKSSNLYSWLKIL